MGHLQVHLEKLLILNEIKVKRYGPPPNAFRKNVRVDEFIIMELIVLVHYMPKFYPCYRI